MSVEQMDIVDFVEQICSLKLFDSQKEYIRKAYDAAKNRKQLYYIPPRGSNRFFYESLQSLGVVLKQKEEKMKDLKDTIIGMQSADYKERFIAEYEQTKIRYKKLKNFCNKVAIAEMTGTEVPKHDCPLELLREQQKYMGMYLSVLEKRAFIEGIDIQEITERRIKR